MRKIIAITALYLISLSSIAWAVDCPIPDTGQTGCYNDEEEITCPSPGQDFYGQDANYAPCNPHSYTKLDETGNNLSDAATNWVMVRDNVTGLIWEVKTDDDSVRDRDNTYNWQDAQDVFIAALNSEEFGGYDDWCLPTVKELSTILNLGITSPTINTEYFPNTVSSLYWSSTTADAVMTAGVWLVDFPHGSMSYGHKSRYFSYVRAVRSGQCGSFDNFIDNGDGTVTDNATSLMWQKDTAPGTYTWEEALSYCENLKLAGYNDWRLPNRNELQSIVDYSQHDPSIDTIFFPNTISSLYWSSTTYAYGPSYAWGISFGHGGMYGLTKSYNLYVRAVRSGQCGSFDTSTTTIEELPCSSEQIYGEHSEETELLRFIRDNVLAQTPEGREIIRLYYQWSPAIVQAMEADEGFKKEVKEMVDGVLMLIVEEVE